MEMPTMTLTNPAATRSQNTTDVWLTPPNIFKALGPFDLDPCAACNRPWDTAAIHYCIHDNGLAHTWLGLIWCNPPYGRQAAKWLKQMAHHNNGIALIFARTETKAFQQWVFGHATSILFLAGRINFCKPDGTRSDRAGAPSCLIAYGQTAHQRLANSNLKGAHIMLHSNQGAKQLEKGVHQ